MGQQELFTLVVAIAAVMIVGRAVASRLAVPEAIEIGDEVRRSISRALDLEEPRPFG